MKTKKTSVLAMSAIVAMLAVVSVAGIPESSAVQQKTYEVTITNLTPGQPLTPHTSSNTCQRCWIFYCR